MSLRARLLSYLAGLHLIFLFFSVALFRDNPALFVAVELMLILSLAGGVHLIGRALEPLGYTRRFHDLLLDQNYSARLQPTDDAELGALVALFNNMLGTLYQERLTLGEQRGFLDHLLEATPSAVVVFDFDGRISLLNASASTLLGLMDAKGHSLRDWLDGAAQWDGALSGNARARSLCLLAQLDALALGASCLITDPDGRRYRGQRGHFVDRGFDRHFLLIDELTAELDSSEKATYEKLIRVLAHEVNNTVAATGSVLDSLLHYSAQLTDSDRLDFGTAVAAVTRRNASLGEFIERFTRVVKMPEPELRPSALSDLVDDILWLYRDRCKSAGIEIGWTRREAVPLHPMDRQLMEQALLNIVKNAIEAVEATMQERGAFAAYVQLELSCEAGGTRLAIIDSGRRLGELAGHQLFTPFFTTKQGGQGIGLLFVREVLQRHSFEYRLAPDAQGETRFDIWLPAPA